MTNETKIQLLGVHRFINSQGYGRSFKYLSLCMSPLILSISPYIYLSIYLTIYISLYLSSLSLLLYFTLYISLDLFLYLSIYFSPTLSLYIYFLLSPPYLATSPCLCIHTLFLYLIAQGIVIICINF